KVESVRDSSVIKATITTNIRTDSSKILNSLLDAYRERRLAVEKHSREIDFFTNQAEISRRALLNLEGRLYDLKRKYDLSSITDQVGLALRDVSATERAGKESAVQVAASEAKLHALEEFMAKEPKTRVVSETDVRNTELDQLIQRRDSLQLEKEKALGK